MSKISKDRQKEFMARTLVGMVMHNRREFTDEECEVYNSILRLLESAGSRVIECSECGETIEQITCPNCKYTFLNPAPIALAPSPGIRGVPDLRKA